MQYIGIGNLLNSCSKQIGVSVQPQKKNMFTAAACSHCEQVNSVRVNSNPYIWPLHLSLQGPGQEGSATGD